MQPRVDLGDGHWMSFAVYHGERAGINIGHHLANGAECVGWVPFAGSTWAKAFAPGQIQEWTVEHMDPLTISPSVLCRTCGDHGFIREGKWIKA